MLLDQQPNMKDIFLHLLLVRKRVKLFEKTKLSMFHLSVLQSLDISHFSINLSSLKLLVLLCKCVSNVRFPFDFLKFADKGYEILHKMS